MNIFADKTAMPANPEMVVKVDQAPGEPQMSSRPYDVTKPQIPGEPINCQMTVQHVERPRFGHKV